VRPPINQHAPNKKRTNPPTVLPKKRSCGPTHQGREGGILAGRMQRCRSLRIRAALPCPAGRRHNCAHLHRMDMVRSVVLETDLQLWILGTLPQPAPLQPKPHMRQPNHSSVPCSRRVRYAQSFSLPWFCRGVPLGACLRVLRPLAVSCFSQYNKVTGRPLPCNKCSSNPWGH